jgi:hypothetical protein
VEGVLSAEFAETSRDGFSPQIREAEAIDKRLLVGVTEDTGFGVSRLWVESDCSKFCKAESKISPGKRGFSIFIQTCGDTEAVPKGEIHEDGWIGRCFFA